MRRDAQKSAALEHFVVHRNDRLTRERTTVERHERARSICTAPEAAGVERLAIHLAFVDNSLSIEEACDALGVAQAARAAGPVH